MFDFNDLFVFEMANNHQGDIEHGKRIIREMAKIVKKYDLKAGVKLQFRHYDTFYSSSYVRETKKIQKLRDFFPQD